MYFLQKSQKWSYFSISKYNDFFFEKKRGLFLEESWTFKIVENPAIPEKTQLLKLSAIARFYCIMVSNIIEIVSKSSIVWLKLLLGG